MKSPLRTLRGRLATTYAVLAVFGVAASALYTADTVSSGLHDRVVLDLADEVRLVAAQIGDPLARGDSAAVNSFVVRAETLTHAQLLIVGRSGELVALSPGRSADDDDGRLTAALAGRTTVDRDPSPRLFGGVEMVRVSVPVASGDGAVVGALEATYTLDDVQAIVTRQNATSLLVAAGAVLIAALAGLMLATSVARPADQVAQAALADQLRVHEQARREFASDVSHELHSLASAMQTAAEALERGAAEANPALGQRLVLGLVGHTRRLVRLADDLLELARWEGGRLRVDAQDMDLAELVRGTLDEWTPEASRRGISLQVRLPLGPLLLHGDPIRLTQALGNLIENALKYAGTNGWVRVDLGPPLLGSYELAVTDSGPGIPLDVLPRVFERYFRVEGRASGGPGGMGLGLAIARAIVLAHGGELTAESPRGSGARFVLRLPVPPAAIGPPRPLQPGLALRAEAALRD
jgi:signal transduction histidine kinase